VPELPDVTVYLERIEARCLGRTLARLQLLSPFILRSVDPPPSALAGKRLVSTTRVGKRLVLGFEDDLYAVIHLMRAGRLRWVEPGGKPPGRITLLVMEFDVGSIAMTEAGT
jgi:formamidopyrimidine-DNA glycosylase